MTLAYFPIMYPRSIVQRKCSAHNPLMASYTEKAARANAEGTNAALPDHHLDGMVPLHAWPIASQPALCHTGRQQLTITENTP